MVQSQHASNIYHTAQCGDNIVQSNEACDDGNQMDNDGCSALCTLESGYMCYSSVRRQDATTLGNMVLWDTLAVQRRLVVLENEEACGRGDICQYESMWQSELWEALYANSTRDTLLPPSGYYCKRFCRETFIAPPGYEFLNDCMPTPINECIRGLTTCDANAYCLEPLDGIGYSCHCDANFFVAGVAGTMCVKSGVELTVNVVGDIRTTAADFDTVDRENILEMRTVLVEKLFQLGYIKQDRSNLALVLEGVADYAPELVQPTMTSPDFAGRSMWRVILRIPYDHIDIALFSNGELFRQYELFSGIFTPSPQHQIHPVQLCTNDRQRTCIENVDCLLGGTCARMPDVTIRFVTTGGSTSPLSLDASSSRIMSAEYNVFTAGFDVKIRYDAALCVLVCLVQIHFNFFEHHDNSI